MKKEKNIKFELLTRSSLKSTGELISYRDYQPFGAPISDRQQKARLGYIDKEQDAESGLADHGVRIYDYHCK